MKVMPDNAKNARLTAVRLTAYPRLRNSDTSKLGWSLRASSHRKRAIMRTPATIGQMTEGASQSLVAEASMIP